MKKVHLLPILLTFIVLVVFSGPAWAEIYYLDSSKGSDANSGTLSAPWKSISKANSILQAGDTVYLRAGIYGRITPSNSGSSGNYITYQRYPGDAEWSATITPSSGYGAILDEKSYIKFDGLYFYDAGSIWIDMDDSEYNIIQNCKFYDANAYSGIRMNNCTNIQILNNIFPDAPIPTRVICAEAYDCTNSQTPWPCCYNKHLGWDTSCNAEWNNKTYNYNSDCSINTAPADFVRINCPSIKVVVSGNTFGSCSHQAINCNQCEDLVSRNNIINNTFHTGACNNSKNSGSGPNYTARTLIEGNAFIDVGSEYLHNPVEGSRKSNWNQPAIQLVGRTSIIRNNRISGSGEGLYISAYNSYGVNRDCDDSHIYHNTVYQNIYNVGLYCNNDVEITGVIVKNNIFQGAIEREVDNRTDYGSTVNYFINNMWTSNADTFYFKNTNTTYKCLEIGDSGDCSNGYVETLYPTEWDSSNFYGNPTFTDAGNNDFTLQSGSTGIDTATYLTQVNDSGGGSGTSIVVDDSLYFYDGWGIVGETGDTIYVNNSSSADFTAVIFSINYSTHTIILTESKTWDDNAEVYHCPSGVCFSGSAPDIGAFEYVHNINDNLPTPTKFYLVPVTSDQ